MTPNYQEILFVILHYDQGAMLKTFIVESCSWKEAKADESWGPAAKLHESSWAASVLSEHMKQVYKLTL